jgi:hypothetical protein
VTSSTAKAIATVASPLPNMEKLRPANSNRKLWCASAARELT